jgi:pyruvate dehydrogenase E1 component beta subunit
MPASPTDAKGLMMAAIRDPNPVVFIDDRWLYGLEEAVPEEPYETPIGKAVRRREGSDATVVALSYLVQEAEKAADELAREGIRVEMLDLRTVKPLDRESILASVRKTGRLVVADPGWLTGGVASEVAALAAGEGFASLKAPVRRVALPDCPAPASRELEAAYYPRWDAIAAAVRDVADAGDFEREGARVT